MAGIFISYRRADSDGWAGRLRDALRSRFGDIVFQDVDNIPDGEIFSDVIDRALEKCDVALVIIGPNWASAIDEEGRRRLDQENDWVRTETSRVLNRKIRVIPVLVGGARMPRPEDLPPDLRSLTHRQAREIRSTTWDSDVSFLAAHIRQIVGHPGRRRMWLVGAPSLLVLLGVAVFAGKHYLQPSTPPIAESPSASSSPTGVAPTPAPPVTTQPKPEELGPIAESRAPGPTPEAAEPAKAKPAEAPPAKRHVAEEPSMKKGKSGESAKAAAIADAEAPASRTARAPRPPPSARTAAPASEPPRPARREPPPAIASSPQPELRTPVPQPEAPVERAPAAAPPKAVSPPPTRTAMLNLPNRPSSARDLKIGDSWTYKLQDARFNKALATVTHEIGGGDASGIRETVRAAGAGSGDGDAARAIQRRLPLEPRMFQQVIDSQSTVLEFAPFLAAFTDLQPGLRWSRIAVPNGDSLGAWTFSGKVVGRENVRVPAGAFEAIKAELEGNADVAFPSTRDAYNEMIAAYQTYTIWFVPEVGREVKYERRTYNRARRLLEHEQYELQSYKLK
jgi:hypothetical protein